MTAEHEGERPMPADYAVVVPTVGRPTLYRMLASLDSQRGPSPTEIVVVDDRPPASTAPQTSVDLGGVVGQPPGNPTTSPRSTEDALEVRVGRLGPRLLRTGGRGPAAARNAGWRATTAEWVVFLDDDVELTADWSDQLVTDLTGCTPDVGACQGRIQVPLPSHRRPTDAERNTAGLATAAWITADMAVRRAALTRVGGFDERFRRAYREDAELALRLLADGWRLTRGKRETVHPVQPAGAWLSVRAQAGNADDALMRRLHGPGWRRAASAPRGRLPWHLLTTSAATVGALAAVLGARRTAVASASAWGALTAQFAWHRIAPGPRTAAEISRMLLTSVAIPPLAVGYRLLGGWRHRHATRLPLEAT